MRYDGLSEEDLANRLAVPRCEVLDSVTSTLDVIHRLAEGGAASKTLVLADEQTAGRGRLGRVWYSQKGTGIWLGYLARPPRASRLGAFSIRVGLLLVRTLRAFGAAVEIKWPNDILLSNRKLAGILCEGKWSEGRLDWVAVGVGINVRGPLPTAIADRAVCLEDAGSVVARTTLLERFVPELHQIWDSDTLEREEIAEFESCNWLKGRRLRAPVSGHVVSVDETGALTVKGDTGLTKLSGGTIEVE